MNIGLAVNTISKICIGLNYNSYIYLNWVCAGALRAVPLNDCGRAIKLLADSGEARSDIAWKIRNIQRSMGIQETFFEE